MIENARPAQLGPTMPVNNDSHRLRYGADHFDRSISPENLLLLIDMLHLISGLRLGPFSLVLHK